jgi:hypothetical protein
MAARAAAAMAAHPLTEALASRTVNAVAAIVNDSRVPNRRGTLCDAEQNLYCDGEMLSTVPGASFDQRFTSGDLKGMPWGIGDVTAEYRHAKPSSSAQSSRVSLHRRAPQASTQAPPGT